MHVRKMTVEKGIRFYPEEAQMLVEEARKNNMTFSEYARGILLNQKQTAVPSEIRDKLHELVKLDRKIGTNINQITHICNGKNDVSVFDYQELLQELRKLEEWDSKMMEFFKKVYE